MYQITYKKRNGDIFKRCRFTLPNQSIGEQTSMGWIIEEIKYSYNNKYYSFDEYKRKLNKYRKYNSFVRSFNKFFKKYATILTLIILLPLYLIEII